MEKLKEIIKSKAVVTGENVIHMDSFLNQKLDVKLINEMALEWKNRFSNSNITKILTIESAGIALATLVGLHLDVPVVYAKKEYTNKVPQDTLMVKIYSFTMKKSYYAYIPDTYIDENDNVLIVDDIIANGWAAEGLVDLCNQANANLVGIAAAVEKNYQLGGKRIRGKGIKVESLAIIKEIDPQTHEIIFEN